MLRFFFLLKPNHLVSLIPSHIICHIISLTIHRQRFPQFSAAEFFCENVREILKSSHQLYSVTLSVTSHHKMLYDLCHFYLSIHSPCLSPHITKCCMISAIFTHRFMSYVLPFHELEGANAHGQTVCQLLRFILPFSIIFFT